MLKKFLRWVGLLPPADKTYLIRLWQFKESPTDEDRDNLILALSKWDGKSDLDLVWGDKLQLTVCTTTANDLHGIVLNPSIEIVRGDAEGIIKLKGK